MEQKKTPKADLQNKRGLFMEIGLVVSLAIVIAALSFNLAGDGLRDALDPKLKD